MEHNHDLVMQFETQFLRSHRTIKDSDKAQIIALHNVGVKSNQIKSNHGTFDPTSWRIREYGVHSKIPLQPYSGKSQQQYAGW